MRRKPIFLLLVLSGLIYGIYIFALPLLTSNKTQATVKTASGNNGGYRVGDRLQQPALSKPTTAQTVPTAFEEVSWFALVPKGWDPMKMFNGSMDKFNDADPRAMDALQKLREAWDNAPTEPTMQGARIRIPGFIIPLEIEHDQVKEFLLVPYFGACIHTPPPPANQIIHVFADKPLKDIRTIDAVWVSGTLEVARSRTMDNTKDIVGSVGYQMKAEIVIPYKKP